MKLKKLVAQALESARISQRQLAEKIGVSHGTINNVMAGLPPKNIPTLQKFADYFRTTIDQLTHDTENPLRAILKLEIDDYGKDKELRKHTRTYSDTLTDYLNRSGLKLFLHNRRVTI